MCKLHWGTLATTFPFGCVCVVVPWRFRCWWRTFLPIQHHQHIVTWPRNGIKGDRCCRRKRGDSVMAAALHHSRLGDNHTPLASYTNRRGVGRVVFCFLGYYDMVEVAGHLVAAFVAVGSVSYA